MIALWFLDESGFAPTLPTGYSWGRLGRRLVVPYEAPQGRRVNAVGALAPADPAGPRLMFETRRKADGRYDAAAHLAFVRRLAGAVPEEAPVPTAFTAATLQLYAWLLVRPVTVTGEVVPLPVMPPQVAM